MRFFLRRIVHATFLLVGVSILSFVLMELAPGDFFAEMRLNPQLSAETLAGLRQQYGLDQPLPVRYLHWVQSVARGEFGFSFAYNTPVAPLLWSRARNTLLLTAPAALLAWLIAIPVGVQSAARQGEWEDKIASAGTTALLAIPELLLALGFLLLSLRTGYLPAGGMISIGFSELSWWGKFQDITAHLAIPVTVLTLGSLPILVRHVRATMLEVLQSPFINAARAHGIPRRRLLYRHALPAALNPLISLFGFSIAGLLSASLLVEIVVSWPGLGPLLLEAILGRDLYVVIGAILLSTMFLVGGTLISDLLLFAADPRIRTR
ncbi:MAG TPA: ABC transporter permease [Terriglobales bacterium]|jgi:peptide/nickel transport system permease protein|nr:ABC transporter permease [Terriglobales bacterium]